MRKTLCLLLVGLFILPEAVNISFAYRLERPFRTVERIESRIENATVGNEGAVGIGVHVATYRNQTSQTEEPYYGHDGLLFNVVATANTRKAIDYDYFTVPSFAYWVDGTQQTQITADDGGAWIQLPFGVTFYGGPGAHNASGIYSRVWVSSNGFLSFDSSLNSSTPMPIPRPESPNALVAPFWSDLDPTGGSILYHSDITYFAVEWRNVLSKFNGKRITFEVVIQDRHFPMFRGQNVIFLLYKDVTWPASASGVPPDPPFYVNSGIEDQEGEKGVQPPHVESGYGIQFLVKLSSSSSPEIRELKILMKKADSMAQLYIDRNPPSIRGHNIQFLSTAPDPNNPPLYVRALAGGVTLLATSGIGLYFGPVGGLIWGATRIGADIAYGYGRELVQARNPQVYDAYVNPATNFAYLNTSAAYTFAPYDYPVDASVGAQVVWVFLDDDKTLDHALTLTAQLKYYSNTLNQMITLETSTTLNVYIGKPQRPSTPSGFSSGYVYSPYTCRSKTTTPDNDYIYYEFDWNDTTTTTIGPVASNIDVWATHAWAFPRTYYVRARAKDASYEIWTDWSPSTSVSLSQNDAASGGDAGNDAGSAVFVVPGPHFGTLYESGLNDFHDFYKFVAAAGDNITVSMSPPSGVDFNIRLYDPDNIQRANSTKGAGFTDRVTKIADKTGNWKIDVYHVTGEGLYSFTNTAVTPPPENGGGGGCPYVWTWNGSRYVLDNNILPTSERINGTDVNDYYKLEESLISRDGKYSLRIGEFEQEHSYIDQVKMFAVDHDSDVKIAVDPNGQILTYKNPVAPASAVDNYGNNRLNEIRYMDGNVLNPVTFFYGNASDYLVLNFGRVGSDNAKLILRDDYKSEEVCIDVQVLNRYGQWQTVITVTPRSYWAIEGVDLSRYVVRNRDFKVRLFWTSPHRLDYAGLDTTRQASYQITYATLVSATHSTQGDVTTLITANDDQYAELIPGQQMQIDFTLPDNPQEARTYILYTEGHYITIP